MGPGEFNLPQDEIQFTYARSSGKGGQNVNKVNSKAVLKWNAVQSKALPFGVRARFLSKFGNRLNSEGELTLMADNHRDQGRNAAECILKLKEMVQSVWTAPKVRRATKPTFGSKVRRLKTKKVNSERKASRREKF